MGSIDGGKYGVGCGKSAVSANQDQGLEILINTKQMCVCDEC